MRTKRFGSMSNAGFETYYIDKENLYLYFKLLEHTFEIGGNGTSFCLGMNEMLFIFKSSYKNKVHFSKGVN